jgi:macrolide-specific efflux system membrane fusion protein
MPPSNANPRRFSLRSPLPIVLIAFVLVGVVAIVATVFMQREEKPKFNTSVVERGDIENLVTATGTLQPRDYVDVGAQVSGQLKVLHVDIGSEVKEGDLLAEIDATVYAANVDGTRAQLASQQAQLRDRESQLKLAEITYRRQANLHKEDATTRETLESAEASLTSVKAQIDVLKAQIRQTESNLRAQEANLNYANIYAPMSGTVVSLTSRQGQTLNANQQAPTIMTIADLSTMTVQTQVSEADISKLKTGMAVYFTTLGSQGRRWYSTLDRIQPTPEVLNNVVLYNALFDVPNDERVLMKQMTTQVFFITSQARNAITVPVSALTFTAPKIPPREPRAAGESSGETAVAENIDRPRQRAADGERRQRMDSNGGEGRAWGQRRPQDAQENTRRPATVEVVKTNGVKEVRPVVVGVTNRIQAEILEGLSEGEVVVTGVRQSTANAASSQSQNRPMGGMPPRMGR